MLTIALHRRDAARRRSSAWHVTLATLLLVLTVAEGSADACTCYDNPPCAAVWKAEAVFIGTVVNRSAERIGGRLNWTVHTVAVDRTLHGTVDSSITLVPGARPTAEEIAASQSYPEGVEVITTCDFRFELGKQYVIYAHRTPDGRWTTSKCSGTKPVEEASADLDFIAKIPSSKPGGRIYGTVERIVRDGADGTAPSAVPAAGVRISIVSAATRLTTRTDRHGKLDVEVPPGEYRVAPIVPKNVQVYGGRPQIAVPARGCAPVHFGLETRD